MKITIKPTIGEDILNFVGRIGDVQIWQNSNDKTKYYLVDAGNQEILGCIESDSQIKISNGDKAS